MRAKLNWAGPILSRVKRVKAKKGANKVPCLCALAKLHRVGKIRLMNSRVSKGLDEV